MMIIIKQQGHYNLYANDTFVGNSWLQGNREIKMESRSFVNIPESEGCVFQA